jgi:CRISPR system Cascade subunit CasC
MEGKKMNKNCYFDFHVIQDVPPSCVNRDDTGSPKTAVYGGTMRARVSSQAWKRAIRQMFPELLSPEMIGYRTKNIAGLLTKEICSINPEIQEETGTALARKIVQLSKISAGKDKKDVLFFISSLQVKAVSKVAVEYYAESGGNVELSDSDTDESVGKKKANKEESNIDKKYVKLLNDALTETPSVDLLLFGRMAASNPTLNYDAAAQVAHCISTHTVTNEYDYFTAVDDCAPEDNSGAGHLGTVEFNSATLYRYATVNVRELAEKLEKDELKMAIRAFTEAFIRSMPTGKQNTFANRTLPDMVYVTLRNDQPVNLAGAFEKPIIAGDDGYLDKSEKALIQYANKVYENYTNAPQKAWIIGCDAGESVKRVKFNELLDAIGKEIEEY